MAPTLPRLTSPLNIAVIGGGWAGMAAAVHATQAGHKVSVFEAARTLGGRARAMRATLPDKTAVQLDNGQHILIGAYSETLALMQLVGVDTDRALLRIPLTLLFPDNMGIRLPRWPAPLDALAGILGARGWNAGDKFSLLRVSARWQLAGFQCAPSVTVAGLCTGISPRVMDELIEPLCVSALNIPAARASGQVFLRVIRDSLFAGSGGSNLLLPRVDLSALFPLAAAQWLATRGCTVETGRRVESLSCGSQDASRWHVDGQTFDSVIIACPPWDAARLISSAGIDVATWLNLANGLQYEAITTVYATSQARLAHPMLSLRSSPTEPAQFVFDRGQLGGPAGLLAFVVSASHGERDILQQQVIAQGQGLGFANLQPLQTVVEKRATFACTPGLQRPPIKVAPGLLACGDYVEGPYPATLEGAVRSAAMAVKCLAPLQK
ncbi:MAG: FAD-dependent oxidoreductase [Bdellovibrionales bacterium]|nr:FAD-dependent oxidoreductase [Ramlibacter sp.]